MLPAASTAVERSSTVPPAAPKLTPAILAAAGVMAVEALEALPVATLLVAATVNV